MKALKEGRSINNFAVHAHTIHIVGNSNKAEVKELKKTSSHSLEFEKSPLQTLFWRLAKNMINDAELVS